MDLEALKKYLNENDTYAKSGRIRLTELREGYAEAILDVNENSLNALKFVQGGAIFTLADMAFAGASNSWGEKAVAMNSTVVFLRPGTGKQLKAATSLVHKGRRSCIFDILITDECGESVAKITSTGFFFEK